MTKAVAALGDSFSDGDTVDTGSGDVFINNKPCARLSDMTMGHQPPGHTLYPPAPIISGSGSVFVNNKPIARLGDAHEVHTDPPHGDPPATHPHDGVISTASGDVFSG